MKPTYEQLQQRITELERRVHLYESIIEQVPSSAVLITDLNGRIEYANENCLNILGYTPDKLTIEFLYLLLQDKESVASFDKMVKNIKAGKSCKGDLNLKRKNNKVLIIRAIGIPVQISAKKKLYVSSFLDITQQHKEEVKKKEKEALYTLLVENLPLALAIYDNNGRFIYVNSYTEGLFHLPPGSMAGKVFHEIFPKETADDQMKVKRLVFKTGKPYTAERKIVWKGKTIHVNVIGHPIFNEKGKVTNVLAIGQDITEQKRHMQFLNIQHQINSLSNKSVNLIASIKKAFQHLLELDWIDSGGVYLFNEDRTKLRLVFSTGLSADYIKHVSVFSKNDDPTKIILRKESKYLQSRTFLEPLKNIIEKENLILVVTIPLIYKNEVIGSLNLGSRSVEDIGQYDRMIINSIASRLADLIVLIKTREELLSSNLKLIKSIKEKEEKQQMLVQKSRLESLGELSAGLAHELNQPLSVIALILENINYKIGKNVVPEEYLVSKLLSIKQNLDKIKNLIDHVRIFSRDQGKIALNKIDVNQVILDALSMTESQLKDRQINIITELKDNIGSSIGNAARLEQVMLNLISNARDALDEKDIFGPSGNNDKTIHIKTSHEENKIVITVRDNGNGITKDNLDKIFNPFFSTKAVGKGTGLGLSIVYGIVKEMDGEISATSSEGQYTEMKIILPFYKKIENN